MLFTLYFIIAVMTFCNDVWCVPQSLFGTISWEIVVLTMLYSIAGLGIAIVNDFKSIEGDR
jgi:chlorophyll/bacteriochlorophyll a synthase